MTTQDRELTKRNRATTKQNSEMTIIELFKAIDFDLMMLAKHEWLATNDSRVADRATMRVFEIRRRLDKVRVALGEQPQPTVLDTTPAAVVR
jgi:hypothetical protein